MQLNRLKSSWRILQIQQLNDPITEEEIFSIINQTEKVTSTYSLLQNVSLFILILLSCQGG